MDELVVIAEPEEICLVQDQSNVLVTGVGALNIIKTLGEIPRETPLFNIGYAGSNTIHVGSRVSIGKVRLYHPNVAYAEPEFELSGNVVCYTSNDFVLQTDILEPCVFDMELAYILALGFKNVTSIKIISDNLDKAEYRKLVEKP